jgi:hypothetical protein
MNPMRTKRINNKPPNLNSTNDNFGGIHNPNGVLEPVKNKYVENI